MGLLDKIMEAHPGYKFKIADGLDDAIIGLDEKSMRLIYSESKVIEVLSREMSEEDAREYYEFNIVSAYLGPDTPIFCQDEGCF